MIKLFTSFLGRPEYGTAIIIALNLSIATHICNLLYGIVINLSTSDIESIINAFTSYAKTLKLV
jgi:hypothetical protein